MRFDPESPAERTPLLDTPLLPHFSSAHVDIPTSSKMPTHFREVPDLIQLIAEFLRLTDVCAYRLASQSFFSCLPGCTAVLKYNKAVAFLLADILIAGGNAYGTWVSEFVFYPHYFLRYTATPTTIISITSPATAELRKLFLREHIALYCAKKIKFFLGVDYLLSQITEKSALISSEARINKNGIYFFVFWMSAFSLTTCLILFFLRNGEPDTLRLTFLINFCVFGLAVLLRMLDSSYEIFYLPWTFSRSGVGVVPASDSVGLRVKLNGDAQRLFAQPPSFQRESSQSLACPTVSSQTA